MPHSFFIKNISSTYFKDLSSIVLYLLPERLEKMLIQEYENLAKTEILNITLDIIQSNKTLPISAKSRAGAEISDFLEMKFVEHTKNSTTLLHSEQAEKGKTKNPWDARTFFKLAGHQEEIWIDFKAFKITETSKSNPDIGTPNKIFELIEKGGFYLLYVHVYYEETNAGLQFVEYKGKLAKSYFLKDVNNSVRRTPSNQLQINLDAEPEYRTREQFINLLNKKVLEGLERQLKNAQARIIKVQNNATNLILKNKQSEYIIEGNLLLIA